MGGFGSGRFGRRSSHLFDSDVLRLAISDLSNTEVFDSLNRSVAVAVGAEVEIAAADTAGYRARCHLGTCTRNEPRHWPRSQRHVQASKWMDTESCFIELVLQQQHFGGYRLWFSCPRECGRKCAVLFREPDTTARAFACRRCYDIRYRSQRLGKGYRLDERASSIISRITRADGEVARPKGMHMKTFERLSRSMEQFIERSLSTPPFL